MELNKVCVKVPASTANLGPGFDVLGMALDMYAWIEMTVCEQTEIELVGSHLEGIPTDKSNLIYEVSAHLFQQAGLPIPELRIAMYSDIPLTRGLGSSASAIVGALLAANELAGRPFSKEQLFVMATGYEKHPDNVGASLFGGMIVAHWNGTTAYHLRIEPPTTLELLVAIPEFQLSTDSARAVLPEQYSRRDAVYNVGYASLLVAAMASGDMQMVRYAMKDCLHQPYRAPLIPGMSRVLEQAVEHGALGVALSGAGPTLIALVDAASTDKQRLEQFLLQTMSNEGVEVKLEWLKPDLAGAHCLTDYDRSSTLIDNIQHQIRK